MPKSLPWLFRVSSGQSLSKSADGFQPFWVPFGGFEALFCVRFGSKSLPSLFRCFSGKSLSKLEDGFQPFWVPFSSFFMGR